MKGYYSWKSIWFPSGSWTLKNCFLGFLFFVCFVCGSVYFAKCGLSLKTQLGQSLVWMSFCSSFSLKLLSSLSHLSHFGKKIKKHPLLVFIHTSFIYSIKNSITIPFIFLSHPSDYIFIQFTKSKTELNAVISDW